MMRRLLNSPEDNCDYLTGARLHEIHVVVGVKVTVLRHARAPLGRNCPQSHVRRKRRADRHLLFEGRRGNLPRRDVLLDLRSLLRSKFHLGESVRTDERSGRDDHEAFQLLRSLAGRQQAYLRS